MLHFPMIRLDSPMCEWRMNKCLEVNEKLRHPSVKTELPIMLSSILRQNNQNQPNKNWYHDVKFDFGSDGNVEENTPPSFALQVPLNEDEQQQQNLDENSQHQAVAAQVAANLPAEHPIELPQFYPHPVDPTAFPYPYDPASVNTQGYQQFGPFFVDYNGMQQFANQNGSFPGFYPSDAYAYTIPPPPPEFFLHPYDQYPYPQPVVSISQVTAGPTRKSVSNSTTKSNVSKNGSLFGEFIGPYERDQEKWYGIPRPPSPDLLPIPPLYRPPGFYDDIQDDEWKGSDDELISREEAAAIKKSHQKELRTKKNKARQVKKKPEEEVDVSMPDGFERVLEKANSPSYIDICNEQRRNRPQEKEDSDAESARKRDYRRCETKVMLQSADGTLFNKFFEEEDIREFAKKFKILRSEYGFSQADVGAALGRRYGSDFSQTTISRFEGLVLSHTNMCKLRPPIESWLNDVRKALDGGVSIEELRRACKRGEFWPSEPQKEDKASLVPPLRKRRKRTSLDASQKLALDSFFHKNQRPDNTQMADIATTLDLEFDVVRVWFCNRRQKVRKVKKPKKEINDEDDLDLTDSDEDGFELDSDIESLPPIKKTKKKKAAKRVSDDSESHSSNFSENEVKYSEILAEKKRKTTKKLTLKILGDK